MIDIGKYTREIECPCCEHKMEVSIHAIANQEVVRCQQCELGIQLVDDGGSTRKSMQKLNQLLADMELTLRNMSELETVPF